MSVQELVAAAVNADASDLADLLATPLKPRILNGEAEGTTALSAAAYMGRDYAVGLLLGTDGVDVNHKSTLTGLTALHAAAALSMLSTVELLLDAGADIDAADNEGETALSHAVANGFVDLAQMLLGRGANANCARIDGQTPLHLAAHSGSRKLVDMLCGSGGDLRRADGVGRTPVSVAVERGTSVVSELLERGGVVNGVSADGQTSLVLAAKCGKASLVSACLSRLGEEVGSRESERGLVDCALWWAVAAKQADAAVVLIGTQRAYTESECETGGGENNNNNNNNNTSAVGNDNTIGTGGSDKNNSSAGDNDHVGDNINNGLHSVVDPPTCGGPPPPSKSHFYTPNLLVCLAAHQGDLYTVRAFVEAYPHLLNAVEPTSSTSVADYALANGHADVVEYLEGVAAATGESLLVGGVRIGGDGAAVANANGGGSDGCGVVGGLGDDSSTQLDSLSSAPTQSYVPPTTGAPTGSDDSANSGVIADSISSLSSAPTVSVPTPAAATASTNSSEVSDLSSAPTQSVPVLSAPTVSSNSEVSDLSSAPTQSYVPPTAPPGTTASSLSEVATSVSDLSSAPTVSVPAFSAASSVAEDYSSAPTVSFQPTAVPVEPSVRSWEAISVATTNQDIDDYSDDDATTLPPPARNANPSPNSNNPASKASNGENESEYSEEMTETQLPSHVVVLLKQASGANLLDEESDSDGEGATVSSDFGRLGGKGDCDGGNSKQCGKGSDNSGLTQPDVLATAMEQLLQRLHSLGSDFVFDHILPTVTLGAGAFGEVKCGVYRDRLVAFKLEKAHEHAHSANSPALAGAAAATGESGGPAAPAAATPAATMSSVVRLASFEHEARMLAAVAEPTHRNCLGFLGVAVSPEIGIAIVTEYVSGGDLRHYLAQHGPFGPVEGVGLCSGLAAGLLYLHEAGVVHGDIKPENILLEYEHPPPYPPPVAGSAASATGAAGGGGERGGGRVYGKWIDLGGGYPYWRGMTARTPRYSGPELLDGAMTEAGSDVFSLACVIFEVLTGVRPQWPRTGADPPLRRLKSTMEATLEPALPLLLRGRSVGATLANCWRFDVHTRPRCRQLCAFLTELHDSLVAEINGVGGEDGGGGVGGDVVGVGGEHSGVNDGGADGATTAVNSTTDSTPTTAALAAHLQPTPSGNSPLMEAVQYGDTDEVDALLEAGERADAPNRWGHTALHVAAVMDNEALLRKLLATEPALVTDMFGNSPLDLALSHRTNFGAAFVTYPILRLYYAQLCVRHCNKSRVPGLGDGGDVDAVAFPLHRAVATQDTGMVRLLLDAGVDVSLPDGTGSTALHTAAALGSMGALRALLAAGADPLAANLVGETPLLKACEAGSLVAVQALLAAGATPDTGNKFGATPLMKAVHGGHRPVVDSLLEAGANVNQARNSGHTPLLDACDKGYADLAAVLLAAGADATVASGDGDTVFHLVAKSDSVDCLEVVLGAAKSVIDSTDNQGWTALAKAAKSGLTDVVNMLLSGGAAVDKPATVLAFTPLVFATQSGHADCAAALIAGGADVNYADPANGLTVLMVGSTSKQANTSTGSQGDALRLLIDAGADVNHAGLNGWTALMYAAQSGTVGAVETLLDAGADVNQTPPDSTLCALWLAAEGGHVPVLEVLLGAGAEPDCKSDSGWPAVAVAANGGHAAAVSALGAGGADVNATGPNGWTATMMAAQGGHTDALNALVECAANIEAQASNDGWRPLMSACQNGHVGAATALLDAGAEINAVSSAGVSGLFAAACQGHAEVVGLLLLRGADATLAPTAPPPPNENVLSWSVGQTPVEAAMAGGHMATAMFLLATGAS